MIMNKQNQCVLSFALGYRTKFLREQWSKAYEKYVLRVAELKILLCAKRDFIKQTWFALERLGA